MVMGTAAPQDEIKTDMTPMIDVVFQLMIFFMCTIKFKTLEGKLTAYLPKDVGVNTSPTTAKLEKVDIVIKVLKEGSKLHSERDEPYVEGSGRPFRWGPDRVIQVQVGSMITTKQAELKARLKQLHDATPDRAATIDPKAKSSYADTVLVLNTAVEAGFTDITFKGSFEE